MEQGEIVMRGKYTLVSLVLAWLVVPLVAMAEPPVRSWNFELLGQVDVATGTPTNMRAYSKIAPWPNTDRTFLNTGCYENGVNPSQFVNGAVLPGCFRVVDGADPLHPKRIATVEVYDRVKSPVPPPPASAYWTTAVNGTLPVNVWTDKKFDWNGSSPLVFSTACGDWAVDAQGKHTGPGWVDTQNNPTCWDRGWITRTHYTAGPSGDFKMPDNGVGFGLNRNSIYWVNSQRQSGAPANRLGYTGVAFYDLEDPAHPKYLSRIDMPFEQNANGRYTNAGGVHHGFFDGRYAYLGAEHAGYIGSILVIVDALDPSNPKIVGKWAVPGQKTPEEDAIRNSTAIDPQTGLVGSSTLRSSRN